METKFYTIGEVSSISGQSVRRIRFYSDKGLLPPSLRTESNYRIYTDTDLAKLELIRALREAGVGLELIGNLFRQKLSLGELLQTRLDILEAEIASKRRAAGVLRAVLRFPNPSDEDLRRIWTMSKHSHRQMQTLVENFIGVIAEGTKLDGEQRRSLVEASVPTLPDDPTAEQIEAWDELSALLVDRDFAREMRVEMQAFWTGALDPAAYQAASIEAYEAAKNGVSTGIRPRSAEAQAIAETWLAKSALAMGREADRSFIDWHVAQYDKNAGRTARYRELHAILQGKPLAEADLKAWTWLNDALKALPER
ncbi:merR regulatory family protein [Sinorhizobium sp. RAC02]|nr:merR regulatory family protein [Sinorhizobium sp. RAC02]